MIKIHRIVERQYILIANIACVILIAVQIAGIKPTLLDNLNSQIFLRCLALAQSVQYLIQLPFQVFRYQQHGQSLLIDLQRENLELLAQVGNLNNLIAVNQDLQNQLSSLNSSQATKSTKSLTLSKIYITKNQAQIDKGANHTVKSGNLVLYSGILIGQVGEVYDEFSRVNLFLNSDLKISGVTQGGEIGLIQGQNGQLVLSLLDLNSQLTPGEIVSSLGSAERGIPSGLVVGQIDRIETDVNQLTKTAYLKFDFPFERMKVVSIEEPI